MGSEESTEYKPTKSQYITEKKKSIKDCGDKRYLKLEEKEFKAFISKENIIKKEINDFRLYFEHGNIFLPYGIESIQPWSGAVLCNSLFLDNKVILTVDIMNQIIEEKPFAMEFTLPKHINFISPGTKINMVVKYCKEKNLHTHGSIDQKDCDITILGPYYSAISMGDNLRQATLTNFTVVVDKI
jgi:hypothetical protein